VCDFGLTPEQKAFLKKRGILAKRPSGLSDGLCSFYYKASIGQYLSDVKGDTIAWLDCDCLVAAPLGEHFRTLIEKLRLYEHYVAVCPDDSGTIGDFIERHKDDKDGTDPFDRLVKDWGISKKLPYLNSAVFLLRGNDFLKQWQRWSFSLPYHVLFEQNVFNGLAYRGFFHLHLLDADVWNVHNSALDRLQPFFTEGKQHLIMDGKPVMVVHATSFMQKSIAVQDISLEVDGMKMRGYYKFIRNATMQHLQVNRLARYIKTHQSLLVESGVMGRLECPPLPEASLSGSNNQRMTP
jgi:hypothetical protein